jgi:hypothetical protein
VTTTSDVPYHVCGAQQDNSTACVSSQAPSGFAAIAGGVDTVFYSVGVCLTTGGILARRTSRR